MEPWCLKAATCLPQGLETTWCGTLQGGERGACGLVNSYRDACPPLRRDSLTSLVRRQALRISFRTRALPPTVPPGRSDVAAAAAAAAGSTVDVQEAPLTSNNNVDRSAELPEHLKENLQIGQLVLMRHGESMWNDLKLFTGDVDIPLTEKGVTEALAGGKAVREIDFDIIFTSRLVRSKQTALIAMTQNQYKRVPVLVRGGYYGNGKTGDANRLRLRDAAANALEHASCRMVPVYADPALNERCYGDLQGLSKEAAVREFGAEVVTRWRRSHDTRPPNGESLQDTYKRTVQFFTRTIQPRVKEGQNVMVVAHGNVLRCIIAHLSGLTDQEMLALQVVTAMPYAYAFDGHEFAECCVMPPIDPNTSERQEGLPRGIASSLKKGAIDSLI